MHVLTQKRVNRFAREFGFEGRESEIFERYVAATYLQKYLKDSYELIEDSVLGGGNDEGIDVALVIVNGQPVWEPSEIEDLISDQSQNSAKVVFIQAKTSEKYDTKLVSKFLHGVEAVTKNAISRGSVDLPPRLVDLSILIDMIAENGDRFNDVQIPCELYYVTTSSNDGSSVRDDLQVKESLGRINQQGFYVDNLQLMTHGHVELANKRREHLGPQKIQFLFEKRQTIPATGAVSEAYIGLLGADEILKLLLDSGNEIRRGIFDDNVRLDLGSGNPVNERIMDTLCSDDRELFPFLNNGLTIVAREIQGAGDRFFISGYQIVNGGQTSNQLIRWVSQIKQGDEGVIANLWVPVKIISSADPEIRSRISVATNLQSPINSTDIQSGKQKAKDVEEYFSQSGAEGLRYARQKSANNLDFPRTRIISTSDLNRAVASVAFGQSSLAIGSPKDLEREESFVWGDYSVEMYYYSAWIVYRIDRFFARVSDVIALRAAKYHIAMVASAILNPGLKESFVANDSRSAVRFIPKGKDIKFGVGTQIGIDQIEEAIENATSIVREAFSDVLLEGRSLRKDDARARIHQNDLLQRLERTSGS